jgi:hypothetical protein
MKPHKAASACDANTAHPQRRDGPHLAQASTGCIPGLGAALLHQCVAFSTMGLDL